MIAEGRLSVDELDMKDRMVLEGGEGEEYEKSSSNLSKSESSLEEQK